LGFSLVVPWRLRSAQGVILALLRCCTAMHWRIRMRAPRIAGHPARRGSCGDRRTLLVAAIAVAAGCATRRLSLRRLACVRRDAFITIVGAVDDIRTIRVGPRLLMQALAWH